MSTAFAATWPNCTIRNRRRSWPRGRWRPPALDTRPRCCQVGECWSQAEACAAVSKAGTNRCRAQSSVRIAVMLKLLLGLGLTALLAVALASQVAWSRPKSSPGCPRHPVEEGAPCKQKHATCHWPCASEGRSDLDC